MQTIAAVTPTLNVLILCNNLTVLVFQDSFETGQAVKVNLKKCCLSEISTVDQQNREFVDANYQSIFTVDSYSTMILISLRNYL
jgi:hypothetical protein